MKLWYGDQKCAHVFTDLPPQIATGDLPFCGARSADFIALDLLQTGRSPANFFAAIFLFSGHHEKPVLGICVKNHYFIY
jgi:hypothetical protein